MKKILCVVIVLICCILAAVVIWMSRRLLPAVLEEAEKLQSRRYEPNVMLAAFLAVVFAQPLAIVPTGSIMIACMVVGYLYGYWGMALVWPAATLGLFLMFVVSRASVGCWGRRWSVEEEDDADLKQTTSSEESELSQGEGCCGLDQRKRIKILNAAQRLMKERPIRSATLLTVGFHSPMMMVFLGIATDIDWPAPLIAAAIDPFKMMLAVLKGVALGKIADIAQDKSNDRSGREKWISLAFSVVGYVAVLIVVVVAVRAVLQELNKEEEGQQHRADSGNGDDIVALQSDQ